MRGLFIDPGGTTGWCIIDYDFDNDAPPVLILTEQTPGDRFPATLSEILADGTMHIDLVVYERFRIHKGTVGSSAVPVLKQIGKIEMVCDEYGVPYLNQPPNNKSFFENRLRNFNMYPTGMEHARDAISHGLYYYMTEYKSRVGKNPSWVLAILPS